VTAEKIRLQEYATKEDFEKFASYLGRQVRLQDIRIEDFFKAYNSLQDIRIEDFFKAYNSLLEDVRAQLRDLRTRFDKAEITMPKNPVSSERGPR
jgi:hypothetical protein